MKEQMEGDRDGVGDVNNLHCVLCSFSSNGHWQARACLA